MPEVVSQSGLYDIDPEPSSHTWDAGSGKGLIGVLFTGQSGGLGYAFAPRYGGLNFTLSPSRFPNWGTDPALAHWNIADVSARSHSRLETSMWYNGHRVQLLALDGEITGVIDSGYAQENSYSNTWIGPTLTLTERCLVIASAASGFGQPDNLNLWDFRDLDYGFTSLQSVYYEDNVKAGFRSYWTTMDAGTYDFTNFRFRWPTDKNLVLVSAFAIKSGAIVTGKGHRRNRKRRRFWLND